MKPKNNKADFDIRELEEKYLDSWQQGNRRPDLGEFLVDLDNDQRQQALNVLLPIDVQYRFQAGEEFESDSYSAYGNDAVAIVAELFADDLPEDQHQINTKRGSTAEDDFFRNSQGWGNSVSEEVPKELVGDRYRLINKIGQGGMGTVWLAQQEQPMRRRVAVKIINKSLGSNEALRRFAAERQALAMMNHPNIAEVLDAGTTADDRPFIVMELVKGIPITDYCNDHNLSIEKRLELMIPVCEAVQHAHQKGIIHRDLKPSNILVSFQHGQAVAKVIDFGLAKALEHTARLTDQSVVTEIGRVVGTLQYMSPEQASSNELDIDTRADVYSLGVVLYQLLVEVLPLEKDELSGKSLIEISQIIANLQVVPPSKRIANDDPKLTEICHQRSTESSRLRRKLEGELDWIVLKSLDRNRTERYPTADSLKEDVRRYLHNEPIVARPPSHVYLLKKFIQKNRSLAASLMTIAAVLVAATTISTFAFVSAKASEKEARFAETRAKKQFEVFLQSFKRTNVLAGATKDMLAVDLLKIAQSDLETGLEDDPTWLAEMLHEIGIVFRGHARFDDSIDALNKSHALRDLHLGVDDIDTHITAIDLSKTEMERWRRQEPKTADDLDSSLQRMELATNELTGLLDENDAMAIELSGDLGTGYFLAFKELKKIDVDRPAYIAKAVDLLSDSVRLKEEKLGERHESTIKTLTNLANAYLRQGDVEQSIKYNMHAVNNWEKLYEGTLAENEKGDVSSGLHSATEETLRRIQLRLSIARGNYAEALHRKGNDTDDKELLSEAIECYQRAVKEQEYILTIGHDVWFNTVGWMVRCYFDAGMMDDAETFRSESIQKIQNNDRIEASAKLALVDQVNQIFDELDSEN